MSTEHSTTEKPLQVPAHTPDDIRDTVAALERRLIGGQRELRRREVAADAGISLHSARKLWRAIGFPELSDDEVFFTKRDEEALATMVGLVREGQLTEETAISLMRSVGQMTDRMVVWQIGAAVGADDRQLADEGSVEQVFDRSGKPGHSSIRLRCVAGIRYRLLNSSAFWRSYTRGA